jgi:hypothetical protein
MISKRGAKYLEIAVLIAVVKKEYSRRKFNNPVDTF